MSDWNWAAALVVGAYAVAAVLGACFVFYAAFLALRAFAACIDRADAALARAAELP